MDSVQSVQSPAPIPTTSGISGEEHQGDRLGLLALQSELQVGKTHPDLSSVTSPDDAAIPVLQPPPAAEAAKTVNQTLQQVSITLLYYIKSQ